MEFPATVRLDRCIIGDMVVHMHSDGLCVNKLVSEPNGMLPFLPYSRIYAATIESESIILKFVSIVIKKGIQEASCHDLIIDCKQAGDALSLLSHVLPHVNSSDLDVDKRRLLVLVNPLGGGRKGLRLYRTLVEPMLKAAKIQTELALTEYPLHAQLLTHELNLSQYNELTIVGGDGLIHEAVNGLLSRKDWNRIRTIPIGIIPAGTSNAVARSLGMTDPIYATFSIIKRHQGMYDAVLYEQGERRFYGHFAFMWGLVADIDIGGNSCRWLGRSRIFWVTLARLLRLRKYHAHITYIDADDIEAIELDVTGDRPCPRYKRFFEEKGALIKEINDTEYYSVIAVKHAYLDRDVFISANIATENSRDAIHMFLVSTSGVSRWNFIKALFYSNGMMIHDDPNWTQYVRIRACRIVFREYENSIVDIDGEQVPKLDIYMESIPQALCYIIPSRQTI